ncbi:hypothetical protein BZP34_14840 (plasmid) [Staphylococcus aureus]|nr:hypothetical protein BZP34_14840 [Staphylococcus aureus]
MSKILFTHKKRSKPFHFKDNERFHKIELFLYSIKTRRNSFHSFQNKAHNFVLNIKIHMRCFKYKNSYEV